MKAQAGRTGGGAAQGSKSPKASALSESMYKSAKANAKRAAQRRATGAKRGK